MTLTSTLFCCSDVDERIDYALNVLSRGLEENQFCSELWQHYLAILARRRDNSDLLDMCKQGLQLAPSYDLHWKVNRACS